MAYKSAILRNMAIDKASSRLTPGILIGVGCILNLFAFLHLKIDGDIDQLLLRGYILAEFSQWTHYGSASSAGMGNIPGSLLSALAGLPMLIVLSPLSPMVLILLLHLVSYLLIDQVLKQSFRYEERLLFLILFWLNPWRLLESFLWNPSYLFFCSALHLWSAYHLREEKSFWMSVVQVVSIGLAFQVHDSSVLLLVTTLYLLLRKKMKVDLKGVSFGAILIVLSLLPYIRESILHPEVSPFIRESGAFIGRGLVKVYPLLKSVSYWVRYGSLYFARPAFNLSFDWLPFTSLNEFLLLAFNLLKWALAGLSVLISVLGNIQFVQLRGSKFSNVSSTQRAVFHYVEASFVSLIVVSCLSPVTFCHWHLFLVFVPCLFPPFIYVLNLFGDRKRPLHYLIIGILSYFVLFNFLAVMGSGKFDSRADVHQQFMEKLEKGSYQPSDMQKK
jgi:hypothetical protein